MRQFNPSIMNSHFDISDSEFIDHFNACILNPADFTHEAHLRLAYINIKKYGIKKAVIKIQEQLQRYVEFVGAKDKYNKTLTIAATKAVYHFVLNAKSDNFKDLLLEYPRLKSHFKELMKSHYSYDIFNHDKAKSKYLQPDLLPFDE